MKKTIFNKQRFLSRVGECVDLGFFTDEEGKFLKFIAENFDEMERDARRYRLYRRLIAEVSSPNNVEKEVKKIDEMLDKELNKKV